MSQIQKKKREFVTKELFIALTPLLASYLWTIFFEAGYASNFGIPFDFIALNITDILLTNRLSLMAAAVGFLWIGLYYNLIPSFSSPIFKFIITLSLGLSIALGFAAGQRHAETKVAYFRLNTSRPTVVLRIYGDKMVAATFSPESKTMQRSFSIHLVGKDPTLRLTFEHLGPLKVE